MQDERKDARWQAPRRRSEASPEAQGGGGELWAQRAGSVGPKGGPGRSWRLLRVEVGRGVPWPSPGATAGHHGCGAARERRDAGPEAAAAQVGRAGGPWVWGCGGRSPPRTRDPLTSNTPCTPLLLGTAWASGSRAAAFAPRRTGPRPGRVARWIWSCLDLPGNPINLGEPEVPPEEEPACHSPLD